MSIFQNLSSKSILAAFYIFGNLRAAWLGVRLGRGARVSPRSDIRGVAFIGDAVIASGACIGPGTYIGSGAIDSGMIGAYCSIGYRVHIGPTEHNMTCWTTSPFLLRAVGEDAQLSAHPIAPPKIGCDVWIGAGAIVLRGAVIGDGAVIAAGALVRHQVPAYEVWGGIPARRLRARFADPAMQRHADSKLTNSLARLRIDAGRWRVPARVGAF